MTYSNAIDKKWQDRWEAERPARFKQERMDKKLYILVMFPYPSGAKLHVGHWYNYGLIDSYARMKRMQGYEVFHPLGFDAFGLPAENYAIKTGIHPKDSTMENIATMRQQMRAMGGHFDWDHELATCTPEYYHWNQWLFLQLYKRGLAYRQKAPVNWCPSCQTVLANEQVVNDGCCERCDSLVEKKALTQWFFKITDYAQELLDCLPGLDWPEPTKKIQSHWIGRSEGAELAFGLEKDGQRLRKEDGSPRLERVFTTRPDTLMGVSYCVVAPESELCDLLTTEKQREAVTAYQVQSSHVSEIDRLSSQREKTGVFTGSYAIHPLTDERLPIWTSDYVIASYGTGFVMAVPAHDERDHAFASRFALPILPVIAPEDGQEAPLPYTALGRLVNSGPYTGLSSSEAMQAIVKDLAKEGLGSAKVNYRLRDWLVSRQRYWGTPIPIIHCPDCGEVPLDEKDLPLELPYDVAFTPDGESPLAKCDSFMQVSCPRCQGPAKRDPDTLDTFVDSSWYQLRYPNPKDESQAFDKELVNALCPVDVYVGGAEHAAMHLLYTRFICKALRDMGHLDFDEPFQRLIHQGMILGPDGNRMSKSRGNTVSPDPYVKRYGSDVFRLTLAFSFAFTEGGPWSEGGLRAIVKFLHRIAALIEALKALPQEGEGLEAKDLNAAQKELRFALHHAIQQVGFDADRFQFNTAVARMMELLNSLGSYQRSPDADPATLHQVSRSLLLLLAPFAPHFCEEMWESLGLPFSIFDQAWPSFDEAALKKDEVEIAIQVQGKIVDRITLPSGLEKDAMIEAASQHAAYESWLHGKSVAKAIAVPGRLINYVLKK